MSVNRTSLGKRISFYRSKSNLTQEVLAAKVNCSREYIVQIENGTKAPSLSVLVKIANTLSVSADELLLDCLEYSSSSANSEIHAPAVNPRSMRERKTTTVPTKSVALPCGKTTASLRNAKPPLPRRLPPRF